MPIKPRKKPATPGRESPKGAADNARGRKPNPVREPVTKSPKGPPKETDFMRKVINSAKGGIAVGSGAATGGVASKLLKKAQEAKKKGK